VLRSNKNKKTCGADMKIIRRGSGVVDSEKASLTTKKIVSCTNDLKRWKHVFTHTLNDTYPFVYEELQLISSPNNLMFVRLNVNGTNLEDVNIAVAYYNSCGVHVVFVFTEYTTEPEDVQLYEWKDKCWKMKEKWQQRLLKQFNNREVSQCDGICKHCKTCETTYWQTIKRLGW
jgi:hypothetical protein